MRSGNPTTQAGSTVIGSSATSYADRCRTASMLVLAAQPACARHGERVLCSDRDRPCVGGQRHVEHVVVVVGCPVAGAVARTDDIVAVTDDPLRHEQSEREFDVVPGGSHGDGERAPADPHLERLLDGELVFTA